MRAEVLIVGDYQPEYPPHEATDRAFEHSRASLGIELDHRWIAPVEFESSHGLAQVQRAAGLWIAPGSPYSSLQGALSAIELARCEPIPLLGTCGGFQHVVLEFARNSLGFADAQHAEYDPYASRLIVARLDCSLKGRRMKLALAPGSRTAAIYGTSHAEESYYCDFGVNPEYAEAIQSGALQVVGSDDEGEIRVVEIPEHEFYIATLFVPQMQSTARAPHPLVTALVRHAAQHASRAAQ